MKLLFLGDFFYDYDYIAEDIERIISYINTNDYKVVVNLETAIFNANNPIKKRGPNLKSNPIIVDILKRMNCICVCLANNHAMDYGAESLLSTIEILAGEGIKCVGAGRNLEQATKPVSFRCNNKDIIIQNYGWDVEETVYATDTTPGCAPLDREKILRNTELLKRNNLKAILINIYHMGFEYNIYPMPIDIDFAHETINAGCNLVVSHHPHVMQPKEQFGNSMVYFSLGNFYFGSRRKTFKNNYERETLNNYGDYGLGVCFDTENLETKEVYFFYDREIDKSEILEDKPGELLKTMAEIDWQSEEYRFLAKEHAYKQNPILGLNLEENKRMLASLRSKYLIANKLQFLKKSKIGSVIYSILKSGA